MYKAMIYRDGEFYTSTKDRKELGGFMKDKGDEFTVKYVTDTSTVRQLDHCIDTMPNKTITQVMIYKLVNERPPVECDTSQSLREWLNKKAEAYFKQVEVKPEAKKKEDKMVEIDVKVEDVEYSTATHTQDRTFEITMKVPIEIVRDGAEAVDQYVREHYEEYDVTEYGDDDYDDRRNFSTEVQDITINTDLDDLLEEEE